MIENLDDALAFYETRAEEFASFGASVLELRSGVLGGFDEIISVLGIPQSYARCATKLRMEGVSLGYFDLCPGDRNDLCRSLLTLNGEARNPKLPAHLVSVAAFDTDIVAVAKGPPHHSDGSVYYVDISSSPTPHVAAIAGGYPDFLVLASALDQAVLEGVDDPETVVGQLASTIGYSNYSSQWRLIASMAV